MSIELTEKEEMVANKMAGTFMGKLFRGAALGIKAAGIGVEYSTKIAGKGIQVAGASIVLAGTGVEAIGAVGSGYLYRKSDNLKAKASEYDGVYEVEPEIETEETSKNFMPSSFNKFFEEQRDKMKNIFESNAVDAEPEQEEEPRYTYEVEEGSF